MSAILSKEPAPLGEKASGLPHEIERIIGRCLRKDAARRFQQMEEVRLALVELKEDSASGAAAAPPRPPPRRWGLIIAAAVLVLGVAGGLGWWMSRPAPAKKGRAQLTRVRSSLTE